MMLALTPASHTRTPTESASGVHVPECKNGLSHQHLLWPVVAACGRAAPTKTSIHAVLREQEL